MKRISERKRKKAIKNIRETFAIFGHDVSDMTDEELEEGMARVSLAMSKVGLTVREFAETMQKFANMMLKWGDK